jgi:hypothetical protein
MTDDSDVPLPALYAGHKAQDAGFQAKLASVVYAAGELGVTRALERGPASAAALGDELGVPADRLVRLLRALTALDVTREREDGLFEAAPMARFTAPPPYSHPASRSGDPFLRCWPALAESVRSGRTAFEIANGAPLFEYLAGDPALRAAFDRKMAARASDRDAALAAAWRPAGPRTVADVGGASGSLLAAVLAADPQARGVLVDRPEVLDAALGGLPAAVRDRIEGAPADILAGPLPAADVFLLSSVLHDWDDPACVEILAGVRRAMPAGARLIVIEMVLPLPGEPVLGPLFDLDMLVLTGGRERTAEEYRRLLAAAGLRMSGAAPLTGLWSSVEAEPA